MHESSTLHPLGIAKWLLSDGEEVRAAQSSGEVRYAGDLACSRPWRTTTDSEGIVEYNRVECRYHISPQSTE